MQPCITSYPSVVPNQTRSCTTIRQRLSRPPIRVGVNVVPSFGYIVAISAEHGTLRTAIRNPATRTFRSTSSLSRTHARRGTSRADGNRNNHPIFNIRQVRNRRVNRRDIRRTKQNPADSHRGSAGFCFVGLSVSVVFNRQPYQTSAEAIYRSKRKPCRFACGATALLFTPSSTAFAAIWSLNASTGRSVLRKS